MGPERVMERALALEVAGAVDDLRQGRLDDAARAAVGAAAVRLRGVPLLVKPLLGADFAEVSDGARHRSPAPLLVVDSLQLTTPPRSAARLEERVALAVRALKALAVARDLVVLVDRPAAAPSAPTVPIRDRRWTISAALGAIKQNADVILMIYREEMYRPGAGRGGCYRADPGQESQRAHRIRGPVLLSSLATLCGHAGRGLDTSSWLGGGPCSSRVPIRPHCFPESFPTRRRPARPSFPRCRWLARSGPTAGGRPARRRAPPSRPVSSCRSPAAISPRSAAFR